MKPPTIVYITDIKDYVSVVEIPLANFLMDRNGCWPSGEFMSKYEVGQLLGGN